MLVAMDCSWIYVGSSSALNVRLAGHHYDLKVRRHPKKRMQDDFDEGKEFMCFFRRCQTRDEAFEVEQHVLGILKDHPGLLNIAIDSRSPWIRGENYVHPLSGTVRSDETKRKMSNAVKKQFDNGRVTFMKGRKHSENTRRMLAEKAKRRVASEETRAKLSEQRKLGKHPRARPVMIENKEYDCVSSAALALNLPYGTVHWRVTTDRPEFKDWTFKSG